MIVKEKSGNAASVNTSNARFATLLRQYDSPHSTIATGGMEPKQDFNLVFAKVKRSLYEDKLGDPFLPPINRES